MLKKYEKEIYQILILFKDENFKERRLKVYSDKPDMLNPLELYVIEDLLILGNNNYFNKLMDCKSNDAIEEYNKFMKVCRNNFDFKLEKYKQYFRKNNNLTDVEKLCMSLILENSAQKELLDKKSKYEYDDLYELDYSTDEGIKHAIINTAVSVGINGIMKGNTSAIEGIRKRQLSKGIFSNIDKEYLINIIRNHPGNFKSIERLAMTFYPIAKQFIDDTNGDEVLSNLFGFDVTEYRTNITGEDIFGKKKDNKVL